MARRSLLACLLAALALLEAGGEAVLRLTVGDSAQGRAAGLLLADRVLQPFDLLFQVVYSIDLWFWHRRRQVKQYIYSVIV